MSQENPYDSKGPSSSGNYQPRPSGNGGGGGGNGFNQRNGGGGGKGFQPREPLTPEQLERLRLPVSVVITGNDRISDSDGMTIDRFIKMIEAKGITIRCGGQSETDKVVAKLARYPEYHLPWKGFDDIEFRGFGSGFNTDECFEFAKRHYLGDFETVNKFQRANHGKTARLLFGKSLRSPAQLVIIWNEDGGETPASTNSRSGIAGHVIRMASASGIPVINVKNPGAEARLSTFLENIYVQHPPKQEQQQQQSQPTGGYSNSFGGNQGRGNESYGDDIPL